MQEDSFDSELDWGQPPALRETAARDDVRSDRGETIAVIFALSPGIVFLANVVIYALLRS